MLVQSKPILIGILIDNFKDGAFSKQDFLNLLFDGNQSKDLNLWIVNLVLEQSLERIEESCFEFEQGLEILV